MILLSHKKEGDVTFATTWMNLEGVTLNEISQRRINTRGCHLHVASEKAKLIEIERRMVVPEAGVVQEMGRYWSNCINF